jgi:uncharacterized BrkB/YihY/UPF0761 family membrane protein
MEVGSIGLIAAIIFLAVFVGAAMIIFSMVKRTMKFAFRILIVAVLLIVGVVGAFSLYYFASGNTNQPAPIRRSR